MKEENNKFREQADGKSRCNYEIKEVYPHCGAKMKEKE